MKLLPVIVTDVPPATGPLFGEIPVTAGTVEATYVKTSAAVFAEVPAGLSRSHPTPPVPGGLTAVIVE